MTACAIYFSTNSVRQRLVEQQAVFHHANLELPARQRRLQAERHAPEPIGQRPAQLHGPAALHRTAGTGKPESDRALLELLRRDHGGDGHGLAARVLAQGRTFAGLLEHEPRTLRHLRLAGRHLHGGERQAFGSGARRSTLAGDAHLVDLRVDREAGLANRPSVPRLDHAVGPRRHLPCRVERHHGVFDIHAILQAGANLERDDDAATIAFAGHGRRRQGDWQVRTPAGPTRSGSPPSSALGRRQVHPPMQQRDAGRARSHDELARPGPCRPMAPARSQSSSRPGSRRRRASARAFASFPSNARPPVRPARSRTTVVSNGWPSRPTSAAGVCDAPRIDGVDRDVGGAGRIDQLRELVVVRAPGPLQPPRSSSAASRRRG